MLNLLYAADTSYVPHVATSLASVTQLNRGLVKSIHIFGMQIEPTDAEALGQIAEEAGIKDCRVWNMADSLPAKLHISNHISRATYLRFLAADVLFPRINHCLYLDSDTIAVGDLSELEEICASIESGRADDCPLWAVPENSGQHLRRFGFQSDRYFNAGILLINLSYWARRNVAKSLFDIEKEFHGQLAWWDQDVLNLVFQNQWLPLDYELNQKKNCVTPQTKIIHFSGKSKPWQFGYSGQGAQEYDSFRSQTPYYPYRKEGFLKYVQSLLGLQKLTKQVRLGNKVLRKTARRLRRLFGAV